MTYSETSPSERRENFRVYFVIPIEAKAKIISLNDKEVSLDKQMSVQLLNLSGSGAKIKTYLNIPDNEDIVINLNFHAEEEYFNLQALIVQKNNDNSRNYYGLKFLHESNREEKRLIKCLNLYQAKNKKYKRLIAKDKLTEHKGLKSAVKLHHLLSYPSYIIDSSRQIITFNSQSNLDMELINSIENENHKCHRVIFQTDVACSFCQLEASREEDEHIQEHVVIDKEDYLIGWMHLERDLYLHYFQRQ